MNRYAIEEMWYLVVKLAPQAIPGIVGVPLKRTRFL